VKEERRSKKDKRCFQMEVSLLVSALGFLAYNIVALPMMNRVARAGGRRVAVNQYFGDELKGRGSQIDFERVEITPDIYGTLEVHPREVTTYCGDTHWQTVNKKYLIH
jgi:hypothetical protein